MVEPLRAGKSGKSAQAPAVKPRQAVERHVARRAREQELPLKPGGSRFDPALFVPTAAVAGTPPTVVTARSAQAGSAGAV